MTDGIALQENRKAIPFVFVPICSKDPKIRLALFWVPRLRGDERMLKRLCRQTQLKLNFVLKLTLPLTHQAQAECGPI